MFHQHHHLQSSGWTAHQSVTGYISTGYKLNSSRSGRGDIQHVLTYIYCLLFILVVYTLYGVSAMQSIKLHRSLGDAAVQDSTLESEILFFKQFAIVPYSTNIERQMDRSFV